MRTMSYIAIALAGVVTGYLIGYVDGWDVAFKAVARLYAPTQSL
jgi:hypothetical protein